MILLDNDLVYTLGAPDPLTDAVTGLVVSDATVTAQLLTSPGRVPIAGTSAALTAAGGGVYRGAVAAAVWGAQVAPGQRVIRQYVADAGGVLGTWEEPDQVGRRRS